MRVLIDADGCPVVDITVVLCREANVPCLILCDTAHRIERDGADTLVFDKGADSVDFALVSRLQKGDIVITQDYGLAAMCLAKNARVLHQDGHRYTQDNIDALLLFRYESAKQRRAGGRFHAAPKRTAAQNAAFRTALKHLLNEDDSSIL